VWAAMVCGADGCVDFLCLSVEFAILSRIKVFVVGVDAARIRGAELS
jgi:hypothetical protein